MNDCARPTRPRDRRHPTSVAVWLVYITTAGGTMATGDAVAMFEAARSMVDRGTLDVPAQPVERAWRGMDGRYYTPFGIGQSLFDVPFVVAGRMAARRDRYQARRSGHDSQGVRGRREHDPGGGRGRIRAACSRGGCRRRAVERADSARPRVRDDAVAVRKVRLQRGADDRGTHGRRLRRRGRALPIDAVDGRRWRRRAGRRALDSTRDVHRGRALALSWLAWEIRRDASALRLLAAAGRQFASLSSLWMTLNAVRFGNPWHTGHEPTFAAGRLSRVSRFAVGCAAASTHRRPWQESRSLFWHGQAT